MHKVEQLHEEASQKLLTQNASFCYREKPRKILAHTYLYMVGSRLCREIFDYNVQEWNDWFKEYVIYVS